MILPFELVIQYRQNIDAKVNVVFVGHYGISLAGKAVKRTVPLWVLFIAVQWIDVLWAIFVLMGIEKVRIVPGITATNPLDLYYMPYTHSLVATVVWSILGFVFYKLFFRRDTQRGAIIVGVAVFSHWVLDFIVHRPDLPLYDNAMKVGLGLWNYPLVAFALEVVILFAGIYFYLRNATPFRGVGVYGMIVFGLVLVAIQGLVFFGAPPTSDKAAALTALISYLVFAAVAAWLDKKRQYSK